MGGTEFGRTGKDLQASTKEVLRLTPAYCIPVLPCMSRKDHELWRKVVSLLMIVCISSNRGFRPSHLHSHSEAPQTSSLLMFEDHEDFVEVPTYRTIIWLEPSIPPLSLGRQGYKAAGADWVIPVSRRPLEAAIACCTKLSGRAARIDSMPSFQLGIGAKCLERLSLPLLAPR